MIIQDENGDCYWGGFEMKSTIKGSLCLNLFFISLVLMPNFSNDTLNAISFLWGLFLLCLPFLYLFAAYNWRAREHAKRGNKTPFKNDPRS